MSQQKKEAYMKFRMGGRLCAVAVCYVLEVSISNDINPLPGAPDFVVGIKRFRDDIVPIINLMMRLQIPMVESNDVPNKFSVMFEIDTVNGKKRFGALVDKVLAVKEFNGVEIKAINNADESLNGASYVKGIIPTDDGKCIYVLDPNLFFSKQELRSIDKALSNDN